MPLLNHSTEKPADATIGEISKILSKWGVQGILTEYEGRQVSSVSFKILVGERTMGFKMPCNWRSVKAALTSYNENRTYKGVGYARKLQKRVDDSDEQAIRVAWRIIKDWIEAQMALVEVNMATVPQVFLPYAITRDGKTLAEKMGEDPSLLLGEGNETP